MLKDHRTWPQWLIDRACPRGDCPLLYAARPFLDQSIAKHQHTFTFAFVSRASAILVASTAHRVAASRRFENGLPALPTYRAHNEQNVLYQAWDLRARERERLRHLSLSMQRILGLDLALAPLEVEAEIAVQDRVADHLVEGGPVVLRDGDGMLPLAENDLQEQFCDCDTHSDAEELTG
jgi:hypothetical protein